MIPEFVTTEEIIQQAHRNLERGAWGYLVGGSESETTLRRNRLAFDRWAFRPRVLVDISSIDASTTFLGHKMRIPVMLAPIGSMQTFDPEGGAASTRGAAEFGTIHVVSSVTRPSLEEISAAADNDKIFQLYVYGDWSFIEDMIARVKQAGYKAFCLTVDTASYSRRERPMLARWEQRKRETPCHQTLTNRAPEAATQVAEVAFLAPVDVLTHTAREHHALDTGCRAERIGQPQSLDLRWRRVLREHGHERVGHPGGNALKLVLAHLLAEAPGATRKGGQTPAGRIETHDTPLRVDDGQTPPELDRRRRYRC